MKNKVHLIAMFCALSLAAMFLPLVTVIDGGGTIHVSGLDAAQRGVMGFVMFLGPILLLAMNDFKGLGKYEGLLAIVVPVLCLIGLIVVMVRMDRYAGADISQAKTAVGAGAILDGLLYVCTAVAGAVEYHDLTLNAAGVERLKEGIHSAQEKLSETARDVSESAREKLSGAAQAVSEAVAGGGEDDGGSPEDPPENRQAARPAPRRSTNFNRTEELLALIERLYQMKEAGVLTEEEFSEKKKQLLTEL